MINRVRFSIVTLLTVGVLGLTGAASSPARQTTYVRCPTICPQIVLPVTCTMSNGSVRTFINRCYASVYACQHGLKIVSCQPAGD